MTRPKPPTVRPRVPKAHAAQATSRHGLKPSAYLSMPISVVVDLAAEAMVGVVVVAVVEEKAAVADAHAKTGPKAMTDR